MTNEKYLFLPARDGYREYIVLAPNIFDAIKAVAKETCESQPSIESKYRCIRMATIRQIKAKPTRSKAAAQS